MKSRWPALLLVLLACVAVVASRSSDPSLLRDTDTRVLLHTIRERGDPLGWFSGDWPLGNHFYRPISTLAFEVDNALWGDDPEGYGATNAVLGALCVLALFWFITELFGSLGLACAGALLYAAWLLDHGARLASLASWLWVPIVALTLLRHPIDWRRGVVAILVSLCLAHEAVGPQLLWYRSVGWLPGRTTTVMTVFALASLAAFARAEALRARGTKVASWAWLGGSAVACGLALGSYEQAVMLPACLLGVSVVALLLGRRPFWAAHAAFWTLLAGYLLLRRALVPSDVSAYQAQQLRDGPGVMLAIYEYLLPAATNLNAFASFVDMGWLSLLVPSLYGSLLSVASNVAGYAASLRFEWRPVFAAGWALSLLAFLPMAWVKPFEHYHVWPMALRTPLVLALAWTLWRLLVPPELAARLRPFRTGTP